MFITSPSFSPPQTITAGSGVTSVLACDPFPMPDTGGVGSTLASVHVACTLENTSAITNAPTTVKLQRRNDGAGTWADVRSIAYTLRGAVGLLAADRLTCAFAVLHQYDGGGNESVEYRIAVSCTGANVTVLDASLLVQAYETAMPGV